MRRELDILVSPFGRAIDACDEARSMDAAEVAEHERVTCLGLVGRALGQAQMPGGISIPAVPLEVGVLRCRVRLDDTPIAIQHVLLAFDELPGVVDARLIQRIRRHAFYRCTRSLRSQALGQLGQLGRCGAAHSASRQLYQHPQPKHRGCWRAGVYVGHGHSAVPAVAGRPT